MQEEHKSESYPIPANTDAIDLTDDFKFDKKHFVVNPKYIVIYFINRKCIII